MTNYEEIKKMSLEEMAAMLYIYSKPFIEVFDFDEAQKELFKKKIRNFLTAEAGGKK